MPMPITSSAADLAGRERLGNPAVKDLEVVAWVLQRCVRRELVAGRGKPLVDDAVAVANLRDRELLSTAQIEKRAHGPTRSRSRRRSSPVGQQARAAHSRSACPGVVRSGLGRIRTGLARCFRLELQNLRGHLVHYVAPWHSLNLAISARRSVVGTGAHGPGRTPVFHEAFISRPGFHGLLGGPSFASREPSLPPGRSRTRSLHRACLDLQGSRAPYSEPGCGSPSERSP